MQNSEFKTYLFSYHYAGAEWSLEIQAENMDDAKSRLTRLPHAKYDGELVAKIPVQLGFFAKVYTAVRNILRSTSQN